MALDNLAIGSAEVELFVENVPGVLCRENQLVMLQPIRVHGPGDETIVVRSGDYPPGGEFEQCGSEPANKGRAACE